MMNNRINERRVSKDENKITLSNVEELLNSLGIDDYDIDRNLQDDYIMVFFNDQNYNLCRI